MIYLRRRYLAAKSEADHYMRELKREQEEIMAVPDTGKVTSRYKLRVNRCMPSDADLTVLYRDCRGGGDRGYSVAVRSGASRVLSGGELPAEEPASLARVHDEVSIKQLLSVYNLKPNRLK